jgi:peptide/nickel transport system ATP-binding protein
MSERPLIEVEGLTRYFDVSKPLLNRIVERLPKSTLRAVHQVSFSIVRGETFALVGESGCGKSTVARMLAGLIRPSGGAIRFDGADVTAVGSGGRAPHRRRLQMIFQDPYASLNPRWRVGDIIAEPILAFGLADDKAEIEERVSDLLRVVKLDPADRAKFPHEFSGGQRQRICIARALSNKPEFIICDEPTSALDVSVQAQILNLMTDLQDRLGLTYLFISHNLAVVDHVADDIGVMYLGRLCEVAPARQLFRRPRHPYTRLLLDTIPDLTLSGRERSPVAGEVPSPIHPPPGCAFHPRCPFANARCRSEIPALRAADGSLVACHAVEEDRLPESVRSPAPGSASLAPARA